MWRLLTHKLTDFVRRPLSLPVLLIFYILQDAKRFCDNIERAMADMKALFD